MGSSINNPPCTHSPEGNRFETKRVELGPHVDFVVMDGVGDDKARYNPVDRGNRGSNF